MFVRHLPGTMNEHGHEGKKEKGPLENAGSASSQIVLPAIIL